MGVEIAEDLFFVERGWLNANNFVFDGMESLIQKGVVLIEGGK